MLSLRDLLTGAVPGNALSQIGLGNANDPQYNRFTYNISGNLGPNRGAGGNGVVTPGVPQIFAGPYSGTFGGDQASAPQQAPQFAPQPSFQANPQQGNSVVPRYSPSYMSFGYDPNRSPYNVNNPWSNFGSSLKDSMLSWKMR